MAAMLSRDAVVPRYLRYKAEDKNAEDYWDEELERANSILHDRVIRMERDKLCTGCARFDWLRTHFYTRQARRSGNRDLRPIDMLWKDEQDPGTWDDHLYPVSLKGIEDDVQWQVFETSMGKNIAELADHPRFQWPIEEHVASACISCSTIFAKASTAEFQRWRGTCPSNPHQRILMVEIGRGAFYEKGGSHRCLQESWRNGLHELHHINTLFVTIVSSNVYRDVFTYYFQPRYSLPESFHHDMPHLCISRWKLQPVIDFDLTAAWIKRCNENHKHDSALLPSHRELGGLRFIDVQNQCVVKRNHHIRYAALSYTWGSRKKYCLTRENVDLLEEKGSIARLSTVLGPTVMDSLQVCTKLEIPYLWIDSLCIVQDDAESKHSQIQNMDHIYANAYITLVSAAEQKSSIKLEESGEEYPIITEDSGLPRVSTPVACRETDYKLPLDDLAYALPGDRYPGEELTNSMCRSLWYSRGWTLQELALSRRALVFTTKEAFFYCPDGMLAETFSPGDDRHRSLPGNDHKSLRICGLLHQPDIASCSRTIHDTVGRFQSVYLSLLNSYCNRYLTFESDRLNAFSGIINAESRILGPCHWGLPIAVFTRALLLLPLDDNVCELNYPSWSWLSRGFPSRGYDSDPESFRDLRPIVHIYVCNEHASIQLLIGARNDRTGVEGYCAETIDVYNRCIDAEPLPILPCIDRMPSLPASVEDISHILIFWSHVARIDVNVLWYVRNEIKEWCHRYNGGMCDIALLAVDFGSNSMIPMDRCLPPLASEQLYWSGIIIQRYQGFARKVEHVRKVKLEVWKTYNPQLELILLA